jgi:hypothetical protein
MGSGQPKRAVSSPLRVNRSDCATGQTHEKKITQRLVEKAGESRSLRYAARRARMRRERKCRAAPVGMTIVGGGGQELVKERRDVRL